MDGNIDLYYIDAIFNYDMTPEEREEDLSRLKEESDKLASWKPM